MHTCINMAIYVYDVLRKICPLKKKIPKYCLFIPRSIAAIFLANKLQAIHFNGSKDVI